MAVAPTPQEPFALVTLVPCSTQPFRPSLKYNGKTHLPTRRSYPKPFPLGTRPACRQHALLLPSTPLASASKVPALWPFVSSTTSASALSPFCAAKRSLREPPSASQPASPRPPHVMESKRFYLQTFHTCQKTTLCSVTSFYLHISEWSCFPI